MMIISKKTTTNAHYILIRIFSPSLSQTHEVSFEILIKTLLDFF